MAHHGKSVPALPCLILATGEPTRTHLALPSSHAMEQTLEFIKNTYGNIRNYLVTIGFTQQHQDRLRETLTKMSSRGEETERVEGTCADTDQGDTETTAANEESLMSPRRKRLDSDPPSRNLSSSHSSTL